MQSIIMSYLWQAPMVLVCLFGMIFAIVHMSKAPKAMTIAALSLGALLLLSFVRPLGHDLLFRFAEGDIDRRGLLSAVWGIICTLIDAAATARVVFAIFCNRDLQPAGYPPVPGGYPSQPQMPPPGGWKPQ